MFAPFETANSSAKRSRVSWWWWSIFGAGSSKIILTKRLFKQLMFRIPSLTLWSLIVIFILYKALSLTDLKINSSSSSSVVGNDERATVLTNSISFRQQQSTITTTTGILLDRLGRSSLTHNDKNVINNNNLNAKIQAPSTIASDFVDDLQQQPTVISRASSSKRNTLSTTRKSTQEYVRQSKVFILIVQNENDHKFAPPSPHKRSQQSFSTQDSSLPGGDHRQTSKPLPGHIRLLTNILESHRIDYTIDTTRTGLPTALLTDQNNSNENKQYSVIIIDDFIKYTKLNRWIRDQLDRHCRTNNIGVVTFLTPEELERQKLDGSMLNPSKHHPNRSLFGLNNRGGGGGGVTTAPAIPKTKGGEESLADQFPLTFKLINQQAASRNSSCTTNCFIDYQLNERSPILRILKRKPNFILNGPLVGNLNQSPWVSMSSNHVTYEPLTWARYRNSVRNSSAQKGKVLRERREVYASLRTVNTRGKDSDVNVIISKRLGAPKRESLSDPTAKGTTSELSLQESSDEYSVTQEYEENQMFASPISQEQQQQLDASMVENEGNGSFLHGTSSFLNNINLIDDDDIERQVLSMFDQGLYDGIKRVIFGGANNHWLNRILLLDAIEHLSSGKIIGPLDRFIQIDIDDIFVGEQGKRMNRSDVDVLIEYQEKFSQKIDGGFKFNLGFSGKYFKRGQDSENEGDEHLISRANEFTWFCHTWSHSKAHLSNNTESISNELKRNLKFARQHGLPIIGQQQQQQQHEQRNNANYKHSNNNNQDDTDEEETIRPLLAPTYAVAPHHSGVYPVHEQLYDAWRDVLNVQVTSTEEYPRLRPASGRRAFVHKTIKVLPRQTCGLYTHTIYRNNYPGGIGRLEASIEGGELFETILHNPVNIYMTHMSNYAKDRLALSTFNALFEFVQANTNLQLRYASSNNTESPSLGPLKLAEYYFSLYPSERQPIWTNPCHDRRHLSIWAPEKRETCNNVPRILIVGPQKTGTTALYTFLKINPIFKTSQMSPTDFEEVQFFNDKHYNEGVDWYFSRFGGGPVNGVEATNNSIASLLVNTGSRSIRGMPSRRYIYLDKSATYFDDPKVPRRASSLLPDARVIILLVNPVDRAYSWYQHIKAHGDITANSLSFEQIIMAKDNDQNLALNSLKKRCLHPGYYSQHLSNWLEYYPSRQIIIIDGEWFKYNPSSVMNRLQLLLRVEEPLDYNKLLVYDNQKGFYCHRDESSRQPKCLGPGKGRKYAPMSQDARVFLNRHYWPHNRQLARILSDIGQPLPQWLDETMGLVSHVSSTIY